MQNVSVISGLLFGWNGVFKYLDVLVISLFREAKWLRLRYAWVDGQSLIYKNIARGMIFWTNSLHKCAENSNMFVAI